VAIAARAVPRLLADEGFEIPMTWPAIMRTRGRLGSEKKPTKTNKSSTLVQAKMPADG
jgi:hypothetical protein